MRISKIDDEWRNAKTNNYRIDSQYKLAFYSEHTPLFIQTLPHNHFYVYIVKLLGARL